MTYRGQYHDEDGYPTHEFLDYLRSHKNLEDLTFDARQAWAFPEYVKHEVTREYYVLMASTVGWSGNESIVEALSDNMFYRSIALSGYRKGGHYLIEIPIKYLTKGLLT